jgi:hypothetical protein
MLAKAPRDRPGAGEVEAMLASMSPTADSAPITAPDPAENPGTTKVMKTLALPVVERLRVRNYRDTRSAPLRAAILIPAAAVAVLLLITSAIVGGSNGAPHSSAAGLQSGSADHAVSEQTAPAKVAVHPLQFLGGDWPSVRARLLHLGLLPMARFTGSGPIQTVVALAPTGRVARGSRITIEVARTNPEPIKPKPKDAGGPPPPGHEPPGQAKKHGRPGPG